MSEPITQELRDAMSRYSTFGGDSVVSMEEEGFENHCAAIDSIHANLERENDRLKCELDRVLGELDDVHKTEGISNKSGGFMQNAEHHTWAPESHYMMLPKDADGEPIHIGDVMDGYGKTIEVVEMRYGRSGWVLISREGSGYADTFAFTHHHAPTVEDVLRGVVTLCHNTWKEGSAFESYDVDDVMKSGNIAEYATKLQLRGDAE